MSRLPAFPRNLPARPAARRLTAFMLTAALAAPAVAQPALESLEAESGVGTQAVGVVALSGYTPLFDDIGYIGSLIGRPETGQALEGMIGLMTQGKGLVGLDKSKPWGVVVETNGVDFVPVICLPIDDLDAILELIQAFGILADDAGGGVTELAVPNSPNPLFAKQVGSWVFIAQTAESLDTPPADPTQLFADLITDYDLGVRLLAQNFPDVYKQLAIDGLRQGVEEGLEQQDDETDEEYAARRRLSEAQIDQLLMIIEQVDQVTVGLAVNEAIGKGVVLDFLMTAVDSSDLAEQLAAMKASATRFAGFHNEGATFQLMASVTTPPEVMAKQAEQTKAALEGVRNQLMKAIDDDLDAPSEEARELVRSAADELFAVYEEMALSGRADMALSVDAAPERLTIVGGAQIPSTDKVESALKKLGQAAAEMPDFPGVNWNAESHAGIAFHTIVAPLPPGAPDEARALLGDTLELAVGIGQGEVYLAAGRNWLSAITTAIDESQAKGPTPVKPVEMTLSLASVSKLVKAFNTGDPKMAELFAAGLAGSQGDDHLRIVLESAGEAGRYRIHLEEGALRGIVSLVEQAAKQAQQGGAVPF